MLAAAQPVEVDAVQAAVERQRDAVMRQPLFMQPRAGFRLVEQVDRALLEHAGADAGEHVLAARPLEDDIVDADAGQQLAEQQAGRPRADDDDLRARHEPMRLDLVRRARSASRSAAAVAATICGSSSHSSVHAAPDRSCSWTSA